jgi:uncharacterized membrane protein YgcG
MFNENKWKSLLVAIIIFMSLVVLIIGSWFFGLLFLPDSHFPSIFLQQFPIWQLFLIVIGACVALVFLSICLDQQDNIRSGFFAMLILFLLAATVFWTIPFTIVVNPDVSMTHTGFTRDSVSLDTYETLNVQNVADGATQVLCIGVNQKCRQESGAPDALNHGLRVQPGQIVTITFNTPGSYSITSETTPDMNLSVDITTPSSGRGGGGGGGGSGSGGDDGGSGGGSGGSGGGDD